MTAHRSRESLLIQHGESVVYVKEQFGHASIQITVDVSTAIPCPAGTVRQSIDSTTRHHLQPPAQPAALVARAVRGYVLWDQGEPVGIAPTTRRLRVAARRSKSREN
jgi:hypothetical protein